MKALELKVFPIWDAGDGTLYADHPDRQWPTNVGYEVYRKRLTDAELAAEYWRARWTGLMHESRGACLTDEHRAKIATVERFMELSHYDEVTA